MQSVTQLSNEKYQLQLRVGELEREKDLSTNHAKQDMANKINALEEEMMIRIQEAETNASRAQEDKFSRERNHYEEEIKKYQQKCNQYRKRCKQLERRMKQGSSFEEANADSVREKLAELRDSQNHELTKTYQELEYALVGIQQKYEEDMIACTQKIENKDNNNDEQLRKLNEQHMTELTDLANHYEEQMQSIKQRVQSFQEQLMSLEYVDSSQAEAFEELKKAQDMQEKSKHVLKQLWENLPTDISTKIAPMCQDLTRALNAFQNSCSVILSTWHLQLQVRLRQDQLRFDLDRKLMIAEMEKKHAEEIQQEKEKQHEHWNEVKNCVENSKPSSGNSIMKDLIYGFSMEREKLLLDQRQYFTKYSIACEELNSTKESLIMQEQDLVDQVLLDAAVRAQEANASSESKDSSPNAASLASLFRSIALLQSSLTSMKSNLNAIDEKRALSHKRKEASQKSEVTTASAKMVVRVIETVVAKCNAIKNGPEQFNSAEAERVAKSLTDAIEQGLCEVIPSYDNEYPAKHSLEGISRQLDISVKKADTAQAAYFNNQLETLRSEIESLKEENQYMHELLAVQNEATKIVVKSFPPVEMVSYIPSESEDKDEKLMFVQSKTKVFCDKVVDEVVRRCKAAVSGSRSDSLQSMRSIMDQKIAMERRSVFYLLQEDLHTTSSSSVNKVTKLQKQIQDLQAELASEKSAAAKKISELLKDNQSARQTSEEYRRETEKSLEAKLHAELSANESKLKSDYEAKIYKQLQVIRQLETKSDDLEREIKAERERYTKERENLSEQLAAAQAKEENACQEKEQLQAVVNSLKEKLEAEDKRIEKLSMDMEHISEDATQREQDLRKHIESLVDGGKKLRGSTINALNDAKDKDKTSRERLTKVWYAKEVEVTRLKGVISSLRNQLRTESRNAGLAQMAVEEKEKVEKHLRSQLTQLQTKNDSLSRIVEAHRDIMRNLLGK